MSHKTYIRKGKKGKGAVLFIHGFLGSPEHFTPFIQYVPQDMTIYNVLLDGHGGTASDFGNSSMEKWKKQIDEIVKKLCSYSNDVYIVCHSMGTFFAYDAAVKYPDNIKGIFALATPLKIFLRPEAALYTVKSFFPKLFEDDERVKMYASSHSVRLTAKPWVYIDWIPRYLELFSESAKAADTICKVKAPTRIYMSEKDELVSLKSIERIPKRRNFKTFILKDSAHFIYGKNDMEFLKSQFKAFIN